MSGFDAKTARSKRPLPLWVDALLRDTALLETDEFGAYIKILVAMWSSRAVALPNDPRKLARAAGVSLRLWNSRVGPSLEEFWTPCEEGLTQKRLRKEAAYTERQVTNQSNRKSSEKQDKSLKDNDVDQSTDTSTDTPTEDPTQLPNYLREDTEPNGSDGQAVDVTEIIWTKCKDWLVSQGVPDKQARSFIGKLLKADGGHSPDQVRQAFKDAYAAKTGDPIPYITEVLKPKPAGPTAEEIQAVMAAALKGKRA